MAYRSPVADMLFILDHVVDYGAVTARDRFAEARGDTAHAVLTEAGRLCDAVLAPLQRVGDTRPAVLEDGTVRTPPGFAEAWREIAEGGWVAMSADPDWGGLALPRALATAVNEMMSGACLSMQVLPLLTQGAIEALERHAGPELQRVYLPKLVSGEWSGTMNLTEPQAGSDVGALRTRAEPNGDGSHAITGHKIYISWADGDFLPNVCHLVLARLPDAPPGTGGISLFLVPRNLPDAQGRPGARNGVRVVSLEHKLGLHGSPTAVMDYDRATGFLVGRRNGGMRAMFTMMNNARLGVGVQGIGVAEAAWQAALAHAEARVQGVPLAGESGAIIDHPDVRRMLLTMRAQIFAARAIALQCAVAIDMARVTQTGEWADRAAFLTPIAKAFGTDTGVEVAGVGIQLHGGMGFVEETGAAQFLRDVRVTTIYEGTNGIQAADLVARKMADGGAAARALIDDVAMLAAEVGAPGALNRPLAEAAHALRNGTEAMLTRAMPDRLAGAVPYLRAFALVLGGAAHLRAAMADPGGARAALARIYMGRLLPAVPGLLAEAAVGSDDLYAIPNAALHS
jgi:acyl-CoA dehydrogenase